MTTILKPCSVPWTISPSMGGVTLHHVQEDEPECSVILGGSRLTKDDAYDQRRIELLFAEVSYARVGSHSDDENIEAIGYKIDRKSNGYDGPDDELAHYNWSHQYWKSNDICLHSGFYYAEKSDWLSNLKNRDAYLQNDYRHYVIDDRDGYIELLAKGYSWREWIWTFGHREDVVKNSNIVASGKGTV